MSWFRKTTRIEIYTLAVGLLEVNSNFAYLPCGSGESFRSQLDANVAEESCGASLQGLTSVPIYGRIAYMELFRPPVRLPFPLLITVHVTIASLL